MDILNQKFVVHPNYNLTFPELWQKTRRSRKFDYTPYLNEKDPTPDQQPYIDYLESLRQRLLGNPMNAASEIELKLITPNHHDCICSIPGQFSQHGLYYVNPWISLEFFMKYSELIDGKNACYGIQAPFGTAINDNMCCIWGYYYGVKQESGSVVRAELTDYGCKNTGGDIRHRWRSNNFIDFYLGSETEGLT